METHTTPIATPEQRQALRRNQQQRLRDQAEALLRAVEALEPPATYKEAEQAAKVLDAVNTETRDDQPTKPAWVTTAEPAAEQAALTSWQAVLDRSLETLAIARRTAREAAP